MAGFANAPTSGSTKIVVLKCARSLKYSKLAPKAVDAVVRMMLPIHSLPSPGKKRDASGSEIILILVLKSIAEWTNTSLNMVGL